MSLAYAEGRLTQLRRELKRVLTPEQARRFSARLEEELGAPTVPPTRIRSLYFDGPGMPLARRALGTPDDCLKIRTKEYAPDLLSAGGGARVVLELKRERAGTTRKRRRWLPAEVLASPPLVLGALGRIVTGRIWPVVGVTYTRTVFQPNDGWRITMDHQLRFFVPCGLSGETEAIEDPRIILEVKVAGGPLPMWLAPLAAGRGECFSKFGTGLARLRRLNGVAGG